MPTFVPDEGRKEAPPTRRRTERRDERTRHGQEFAFPKVTWPGGFFYPVASRDPDATLFWPQVEVYDALKLLLIRIAHGRKKIQPSQGLDGVHRRKVWRQIGLLPVF